MPTSSCQPRRTSTGSGRQRHRSPFKVQGLRQTRRGVDAQQARHGQRRTCVRASVLATAPWKASQASPAPSSSRSASTAGAPNAQRTTALARTWRRRGHAPTWHSVTALTAMTLDTCMHGTHHLQQPCKLSYLLQFCSMFDSWLCLVSVPELSCEQAHVEIDCPFLKHCFS